MLINYHCSYYDTKLTCQHHCWPRHEVEGKYDVVKEPKQFASSEEEELRV
jgi:hypothetical protein